MALAERLALAAMRRLDPETAHDLAHRGMRAGLTGGTGPITSARLKTDLAGLALPNPIGLAAGLDKDCTALVPLSRAGFGWLEVGAVTPRAQPGNPKPRLFRLREDRAIINRFGFNNAGMDQAADRLADRPRLVPVGLNLGANKDSSDRAADYAAVFARCAPFVDFVTVNVSSPNTAGLRDLQGREALNRVLEGVLNTRAGTGAAVPVFLKIAPDLDRAGLADIATVAEAAGIDAIIATNTMLARPATLKSRHAPEAGGLSGTPLFIPSTRVLARLSDLTGGRIPLVGVGGIASGADAYAKIRAGASAVQLYSALVYGGLSLVTRIARDLDRLLIRDGFQTVAEAVGTGRNDWLD
ncbi:MAG: quinone-dependent dihydroorotate dehydrogenase [Qingshengfaniella sp.]